MTTVSEVLTLLKKEGYTVDFNLTDSCLLCHGNSLQLHPDEFLVDKHYRFEGLSDPGDEAVVYAISSAKHQVKGTLVNGYGMYSETMTDDLVKALREKAPAVSPVTAEKSNEATPQRPAGSRVLNAPLVTLDLTKAREQIKQEPAWQTSDRNALTLFKSDGMRLVLMALHEGATLKTHTAPGIISVQVLEGLLDFRTAAQAVELGPGELLTLQAGIPHRVEALEESVFLLTLGR
ncbi:cupin domain-containing protein [Hymenobacter sp. DG25A]|uniref:cupin domain-containing protein n=1 Tax=Hymenobacter sp. DG25A TaxID=1385663 RepID=UPI0008FFBBAF|nr:cupin domain-containing protein [Hymenobacter sp. DG25A]